jgi:electron transport complex protein RnfA
MHGKFVWFLTLAVFSGLSMNLILRFGIGLQRIALEEEPRDLGENAKWVFFVWPGIYFISVMLLWLFFSVLQSVLFLGFLEYILIFPVTSLLFTAIECLAKRLDLRTGWRGGTVSFYLMAEAGGTAVNGAPVGGASVGAALFIILGLAGSLAEAAVLSFGFSAGAALSVLTVGEIRRRSAMEAVPRCLRGGPLVFITMGLLSLVCMSAAMVLYAVLGAD